MIFKKLARWVWCLFFPPIIYKQKVVTMDPCWKHLKFKKGCVLCRNMNAN